ncbi:hypothetical protein LTS18_000726, partial [Coniosporium uncinatum]
KAVAFLSLPHVGHNVSHDICRRGLSNRPVVERSKKSFPSRAVSFITLFAGAVFARITTATPAKGKAYTSVQVCKTEHIERKSELIYCNHTCNPTVVFDMKALEVRVGSDRELKVGYILTCSCPSTERDTAQPFECNCRPGQCTSKMMVARDMSRDVLRNTG